MLLLVVGIAGVAIWKHCDIFPDMCKGDEPKSKVSTGPQSAETLKSGGSGCPGGQHKDANGSCVKNTINFGATAGINTTNYAYAHYAKTLSQHGARLFI